MNVLVAILMLHYPNCVYNGSECGYGYAKFHVPYGILHDYIHMKNTYHTMGTQFIIIQWVYNVDMDYAKFHVLYGILHDYIHMKNTYHTMGTQ